MYIQLQLTPEEEERRRLRRHKNKLAAQKCRSKKRKLAETLEDVSAIFKFISTTFRLNLKTIVKVYVRYLSNDPVQG